jgi:hypothetical protein
MITTANVIAHKPLTITTHDVFEMVCESPDGAAHIEGALERFLAGDWGIVPESDHRRNDESVNDGTRILGAYMVPGGKIWIIADPVDEPWEPRRITILTPGEY